MAFFDPTTLADERITALLNVDRQGTTGLEPAGSVRAPIMAFQLLPAQDSPEAAGPGGAEGFPKLVLAVNPSSLNLSETHNIVRSKTRGAYVEEHWGKELSEISASGSTLGFYSIADSVTTFSPQVPFANDTDDFLESRKRPEKVLTIGDARRDTIAYRNLLAMVDVFRNNGAEYAFDGSPVNWPGVNMVFDNGSYDGWFTSLSIEEGVDMPFRFEYSFSFQVRKTVYRLAGDISPGAIS